MWSVTRTTTLSRSLGGKGLVEFLPLRLRPKLRSLDKGLEVLVNEFEANDSDVNQEHCTLLLRQAHCRVELHASELASHPWLARESAFTMAEELCRTDQNDFSD